MLKAAKGSARDRGADRLRLIFINSINDVTYFRTNFIIMKSLSTIIILFLAVISMSAQDIAGSWSGAITIPDGQLTVVFNISETDDGYSSTLDSPDQDALGIPVDSTFYKKPELTIKVTNLDLVYVGTLVDDATLNGTLTQMGQTLELNMKRKTE